MWTRDRNKSLKDSHFSWSTENAGSVIFGRHLSLGLPGWCYRYRRRLWLFRQPWLFIIKMAKCTWLVNLDRRVTIIGYINVFLTDLVISQTFVIPFKFCPLSIEELLSTAQIAGVYVSPNLRVFWVKLVIRSARASCLLRTPPSCGRALIDWSVWWCSCGAEK